MKCIFNSDKDKPDKDAVKTSEDSTDFKSFTAGDGFTDEPKPKRKYVKRECKYYSIYCKSYGSVLYSSSFRKSRFIIQNYSGYTASEIVFVFFSF